MFPPQTGQNQFAFGDERGAIFVGLAAMHTLMVREHNRCVYQSID